MDDARPTTSVGTRAFVKRSRKSGKLMRITQEHYLRDDIGFGEEFATNVAAPLSLEPFRNQYLVLDTNVVLHQIDVLEKPTEAFANVIVLQTVLDEVRHRDIGVFNRLHALIRDASRGFSVLPNEHVRGAYIGEGRKGESPNDRNDRAIRVATQWCIESVALWCATSAAADDESEPFGVLLLTNDRLNREAAVAAGLRAMTVHQYVRGVATELPALKALADSLAGSPAADEAEDAGGAGAQQRQSKRRRTGATGAGAAASASLFTPHLSAEVVEQRIKLRTTERLYRGVYRQSQYHWHEGSANISTGDGGRKGAKGGGAESTMQNVIILGRDAVNRAFDGDVVAIEMLPRAEWRRRADEPVPSASTSVAAEPGAVAPRPNARIVAIIKRNWRPCCGTVLHRESDVARGRLAIFVPVDPKMPRIAFETNQREALLGQWIVVAPDTWRKDDSRPRGHYVRTVGAVGEKSVETEVILLEHDIPTEAFSPSVVACLPPVDWAITPANATAYGRRDMRHLPVCSIDPPGCRDIDDALHCLRLPNGNLQVGVHIADVSYFVRPDTAIDLEAARRSTTTYIVERRLDMLPKLLTETLCSVVGEADRFVFSVVWELTPDCEVVGVEYHRSIVHSVAALSYKKAQAIHDDPSRTDDLAVSIRDLMKLSRVLREKRMQAGAVTLASPEIRFEMDQTTKDPTDVRTYDHVDTNSLVEEFMLLANIAVATKIEEAFPAYALLRRHPQPDPRRFEKLSAVCASFGCELKTATNLELATSLNAACATLGERVKESSDGELLGTVLRIMTTRCMSQAVYFCAGQQSRAEYRHYGLAVPIYTHFTSPIRRYADVIVHRMLGAAIGVEPLVAGYDDKAAQASLCDNINRRTLMAQLAGRASTELYTRIFLKNATGDVVEKAIVMAARPRGVVVFVARIGVEAFVKLVEEEWTFSEADPASGAHLNTLTPVDGGCAPLHALSEIMVSIALEKTNASREAVKMTIVRE